MPATPLHIGIPGLIGYYRPKKVDIVAAVIGSVIIDVDFFLFLMLGTPVHGYLHSFLSATIIAIALAGILWLLNPSMIKLKEWFRWETETGPKSLLAGAFIGTYSHIILDMLLYKEMNPLFPLKGNPFYFSGFALPIFIGVYAVAAITTVAFLMVYARKYARENGNGIFE